MRKFSEAVRTECQTPEAQYHITISGNKISVEVDLPMELDINEDAANLLESNIHNAMELVLARYFINNQD